jgi:hypothetical protein
MSNVSERKEAAVRLEGGVGDHVLGMRILRFIHMRWPCHDIVVYSDCGGASTQLDMAAMSPYVSRVVPIYQRAPAKRQADMGKLENIRSEDLKTMFSADLFIDAHGLTLFVPAAVLLNVPIYDILAHRPELSLPPHARVDADRLLASYDGATFVGLNLMKYGGTVLGYYKPRIIHVLRRLLADPRVVVLNLLTSQYEFPHWPQPDREVREQQSREESAFCQALCQLSDRILPVIDQPIATVAALLQRCRYYIGLDNGTKHLAWALNVPSTYFVTAEFEPFRAIRWLPDVHRYLTFDCKDDALESHLEEARALLAG